MKINEIIYENILDKLLGRNPQDRERAVNTQATAQMANMAARAWGKYKQNLERINNYNPVPDKMLSTKLIEWIDNNLLGSYSLANGGNVLNGVVTRMVQNIMRYPERTEDSFKQILIVAAKVALDPTAGKPNFAPQPGQRAGTDTAPFTITGNTAKFGNMELDLSDPDQRQIYDRIRDEVPKGIIKV